MRNVFDSRRTGATTVSDHLRLHHSEVTFTGKSYLVARTRAVINGRFSALELVHAGVGSSDFIPAVRVGCRISRGADGRLIMTMRCARVDDDAPWLQQLGHFPAYAGLENKSGWFGRGADTILVRVRYCSVWCIQMSLCGRVVARFFTHLWIFVTCLQHDRFCTAYIVGPPGSVEQSAADPISLLLGLFGLSKTCRLTEWSVLGLFGVCSAPSVGGSPLNKKVVSTEQSRACP